MRNLLLLSQSSKHILRKNSLNLPKIYSTFPETFTEIHTFFPELANKVILPEFKDTKILTKNTNQPVMIKKHITKHILKLILKDNQQKSKHLVKLFKFSLLVLSN